jgi:hypothetical protein
VRPVGAAESQVDDGPFPHHPGKIPTRLLNIFLYVIPVQFLGCSHGVPFVQQRTGFIVYQRIILEYPPE